MFSYPPYFQRMKLLTKYCKVSRMNFHKFSKVSLYLPPYIFKNQNQLSVLQYFNVHPVISISMFLLSAAICLSSYKCSSLFFCFCSTPSFYTTCSFHFFLASFATSFLFLVLMIDEQFMLFWCFNAEFFCIFYIMS